jgi:thymidylate synthase
MTPHAEMQYNNIMLDLLVNGVSTPDRTGVGCVKTWNRQIVFGVGEWPFSTKRRLSSEKAWTEMRFFLSGYTNTHLLEKQGVTWWKGNTSREFLDNRGLQHLFEGSLGTSYSHQMRNAGGEIDQVQQLIDGLKNDPFSRRHAIDLWGITEQDEMPLLPCWWRSNWGVELLRNGRKMLHLKLYSRSLDLLFGYWMAAMQYRMFQLTLCKMLDMEMGAMVTDLWDVHLYVNQIDFVKELVGRGYGTPGTVSLKNHVVIESIDDICNLNPSDFLVSNYLPNVSQMVTPVPAMAV